MGVSSNRIVAGPAYVMISATTIGHTKEGARILSRKGATRIHSHESGEAVLAIYPRGGRHFRLEVDMMEISAANLAKICSDISATTNVVSFRSNKDLDSFKTYNTVKLVQKNASGVSTAFVLEHAVALVEEMEFLGRNEDDMTWLIKGIFETRHVDSATIARISQTGIGP